MFFFQKDSRSLFSFLKLMTFFLNLNCFVFFLNFFKEEYMPESYLATNNCVLTTSNREFSGPGSDL